MRPAAPLFIFLLTLFCGDAQNFDSACVRQKQVMALLRRHHFSPPPDNVTTRKEILDLYIKSADEKNLFFMQHEVRDLELLCESGSIETVSCDLIRASHRLMTARLRQLDSLTLVVENRPLALDGNDTINFVAHRRERFYCASLAELQKRLEKRVKYETLQSLHNSPALLASASVVREETSLAPVNNVRARAVQKLRRSYARFHDFNLLLNHLGDCMSDAMARRCDPHSSYLNSTDLSKYRKALSTHEQSFGFSVTENKTGETVVSDIIPGGPAWKNDLIEEGDVLATLSGISGDAFSSAELGVAELSERLDDPAMAQVTLQLIKKDRQRVEVTLSREKIVSVENALSSFVVTTRGRRMGFIPLSSFYLDQDNDSRNGCANDVAKEIIELRNDSVEGIIIDLRYNGGGSMREAMALAGLFINEGPVAIYRQRDEKPFLLKDMHRGTVWDGPLLILINSASASASEFVTAALQDYNRAIVAGSGSFGKGSAQNLMMADTAATDDNADRYSKSGVLKITAGKFYRVSAQSHQARGIEPDVEIPGLIDKVMEREAAYPFHLPYDTLENAAGIARLPKLPLKALKQRSATRIAAHPSFGQIISMGDSLRYMAQRNEKVALSIPGYRDYSDKQKRVNLRMESLLNGEDNSIVIRNNSANEQVMAISDFLARSSARSMERLKHDVTFQESVHIMTDLIELCGK